MSGTTITEAFIDNIRALSYRALPREAIVTAFEVQARGRMAATGMGVEGFHKPGVTGLFGAAVAAAKLLDLNRRQMLMAFGLAGSRAGSLSISVQYVSLIALLDGEVTVDSFANVELVERLETLPCSTEIMAIARCEASKA